MTLTPDDAPVALLSDEAERTLAESLRAAYAPEPLDDELNEALILAALDDPLAPPSAAELAESEALRRALEGEGEHPDAALARALRAAAAPGALRPEPGERLLARAVAPRRASVVFVGFGAAATIAAAAAVVLFWARPVERSGHGAAPPEMAALEPVRLLQSRSTAPLFAREAFDGASATARIDRIARERARELRANQYALWGVR